MAEFDAPQSDVNAAKFIGWAPMVKGSSRVVLDHLRSTEDGCRTMIENHMKVWATNHGATVVPVKVFIQEVQEPPTPSDRPW